MRRLNYFQNRPKLTKIDAFAYLERLRLVREDPGLDYLKRLHKAHLQQIPHENLEIQFSRKRKWDIRSLFEAIILTENRGGIGLELNFLFYHLLDQLGFQCFPTTASLKAEGQEFGPRYQHMIILVFEEDAIWIADVGSKGGPLTPKQVIENQLQVDYNRYMRLHRDPDENWLLQISGDMSNFTTLYRFREQETQYIEFIDMHQFYQTGVESPYVDQKYISKWSKDGLVTLTDRKLQIATSEEPVQSLMNEDAFLAQLEEHFGIHLSDLLQ